MARGRKENLVSLGDRTREEQRQITQKGGIASGVARREKKKVLELLEMYVGKKHSVPDEDGNEQTKLAAAVASFVERQIETGDGDGFIKLMTALGQKPADKVQSQETVKVTYQWRE